MLVRESDFSREAFADIVSRFRLEGAYDLEVVSGGATLAVRCTIARDQATPSRFPMACITPDGQAFEGLGVPDRRNPVSIG
jgi:hypothetical protein